MIGTLLSSYCHGKLGPGKRKRFVPSYGRGLYYRPFKQILEGADESAWDQGECSPLGHAHSFNWLLDRVLCASRRSVCGRSRERSDARDESARVATEHLWRRPR